MNHLRNGSSKKLIIGRMTALLLALIILSVSVSFANDDDFTVDNENEIIMEETTQAERLISPANIRMINYAVSASDIDFNATPNVTVASGGIIDGDVLVPPGGHLTLGLGGTISGQITVFGGGSFSMLGGTVSAHIFDEHAVRVLGGTFEMTSGAIRDSAGGGVEVSGGGTFTMNGGTITNNGTFGSALVGGGVYVENGTFFMHDGTIEENRAQFGGGLGLSSGAFVNMTGGSITRNEAFSGGGIGFQEWYGDFLLNQVSVWHDAQIFDNTAMNGSHINDMMFHMHSYRIHPGVFTLHYPHVFNNSDIQSPPMPATTISVIYRFNGSETGHVRHYFMYWGAELHLAANTFAGYTFAGWEWSPWEGEIHDPTSQETFFTMFVMHDILIFADFVSSDVFMEVENFPAHLQPDMQTPSGVITPGDMLILTEGTWPETWTFLGWTADAFSLVHGVPAIGNLIPAPDFAPPEDFTITAVWGNDHGIIGIPNMERIPEVIIENDGSNSLTVALAPDNYVPDFDYIIGGEGEIFIHVTPPSGRYFYYGTVVTVPPGYEIVNGPELDEDGNLNVAIRRIPLIPTPTPEPDYTPLPSPTPVPSYTPIPTPSPIPDYTPTPTPMPGYIPTPTPMPGYVPTSTPTPTPGYAPTSTSAPSSTPAPIPTPVSTPSPQPAHPPQPMPNPPLNTGESTALAPLGTHHAFLIGFDDGTIRPTETITRAQIATIMFRLLPDAERVKYWSQSNNHPDVELHHWFNNAISTTSSKGLFTGMPDGNFLPNRSITRAELAVVIARLKDATYNGVSLFNDIASHWAEAEINAAAYNGWINGYDGLGGQFLPNQPVTRAEAAAIITRAYGKRPYDATTLLPGMRVWSDNMDTKTWYYLYIQDATNSHYYVIKDDVFKIWVQLMSPERDWARLELPVSRPEDI